MRSEMKSSKKKFAIDLPRERIVAFCKKWKIQELAFFGSLVTGDFGPDSDIDVLVRYRPGAKRSLLEHAGAREELAEILGRPVDLVSKHAIERSQNKHKRQTILGEARVYYLDEKAA